MSRSKREIPHYYLSHEVILDTALGWLTEQNAGLSITERMLPAVLQLKAVALAAQKFKRVQRLLERRRLRAVRPGPCGRGDLAARRGAWWPRRSTTSTKKLDELMRDLTDLVGRARAGSLRSSRCPTRPSR